MQMQKHFRNILVSIICCVMIIGICVSVSADTTVYVSSGDLDDNFTLELDDLESLDDVIEWLRNENYFDVYVDNSGSSHDYVYFSVPGLNKLPETILRTKIPNTGFSSEHTVETSETGNHWEQYTRFGNFPTATYQGETNYYTYSVGSLVPKGFVNKVRSVIRFLFGGSATEAPDLDTFLYIKYSGNDYTDNYYLRAFYDNDFEDFLEDLDDSDQVYSGNYIITAEMLREESEDYDGSETGYNKWIYILGPDILEEVAIETCAQADEELHYQPERFLPYDVSRTDEDGEFDESLVMDPRWGSRSGSWAVTNITTFFDYVCSIASMIIEAIEDFFENPVVSAVCGVLFMLVVIISLIFICFEFIRYLKSSTGVGTQAFQKIFSVFIMVLIFSICIFPRAFCNAVENLVHPITNYLAYTSSLDTIEGESLQSKFYFVHGLSAYDYFAFGHHVDDVSEFDSPVSSDERFDFDFQNQIQTGNRGNMFRFIDYVEQPVLNVDKDGDDIEITTTTNPNFVRKVQTENDWGSLFASVYFLLAGAIHTIAFLEFLFFIVFAMIKYITKAMTSWEIDYDFVGLLKDLGMQVLFMIVVDATVGIIYILSQHDYPSQVMASFTIIVVAIMSFLIIKLVSRKLGGKIVKKLLRTEGAA